MASHTPLDPDLLRPICDKPPADVATLLRQAQALHGCDAVYRSLIDSIHLGAIPPTVLHIFLGTCKAPAPLAAALGQSTSALGRKLAIKHVGKRARADADFLPFWECIGGTVGFMALMATLSVDEVERLCQVIGDASTTERPSEGRQACITDLVHALGRTGDQERPSPCNPDPRPLVSFYRLLLPACIPQLVVQRTPLSERPSRRTVQAHSRAFQAHVLEQVFAKADQGTKITPYRHVLDQSLDFAMEVMRRLEQSPQHLQINRNNIMKDVAYPLARRLVRRRERDDLQLEFYNLFISCAQKEPSVAAQIHKGFTIKAVSAWKRARTPQNDAALERVVCRLLHLIKDEAQCDFSVIQFQMSTVNPARRFKLLQMYLKHAEGYGTDLTLSPETIGANFKALEIRWPVRIFLLLPSGISVKLLNTLHAVHPDGNFLGELKGMDCRRILAEGVDDDVKLANLDILFAALHARDHQPPSVWFEQAKKILDQRKKLAATARSGDKRPKLVEAAINMSIATGCLDTYGDTLLWARRFNKDSKTIEKIYSSVSVNTHEGLSLLSGMPGPDEKYDFSSLSLASIRSNIGAANRIILQALETISSILHEPTYKYYQVAGIVNLPVQVVRYRMERASSSLNAHGASDADIFDNVWSPTIAMLIEFERFGLQEGREKLRLNSVFGPLYGLVVEPVSKPHVRRFLDQYCQSRDALWKDYRATNKPATLGLTSVWPRGLPAQYLSHIPQETLEDMPYLESRAKAVVFSGKEILAPLPVDEDTRGAIGPFVENYHFSLAVYVTSVAEGSERDARICHAWDHAVTNLSREDFSTQEAELFWSSVFEKISEFALPTRIASIRRPRQPTFPVDNQPCDLAEWDPDPDTSLMMKTEQRHETVLDCVLDQKHLGRLNRYSTAKLPFVPPKTRSAVPKSPGIWKQKTPIKLPVATRDALTAAAVLYLNTKHGCDASILKSPFPSAAFPRIPALYLDAEFVERERSEAEMEDVLLLLAKLSSSVPVDLLRQLNQSLFDKIGATEGELGSLHEAAMGVLTRLARSDRPESACESIRNIVLDNQNDSSWHRHFVNKKFLRTLQASHARSFVEDLCRAVIDKVHTQTEKTKAQEAGGELSKEASSPLIKVTTIKMIAQILRQATYVSCECARSILEHLVVSAPHHDIQVSILESLLAMRSETDDATLRKCILDVLEAHIVPRAASVNERDPISEENWRKAENNMDEAMPLVYEDEDLDELPPLMKLLQGESSKKYLHKDPGELKLWMSRVIMPLIEQSAANHVRWTRLFLRRNGFETATADDLPLVPVRLKILLENLTRYPEHLADTAFPAAKQLQWILVAPTRSMQSTTATIQANSDLRQSNGGRHWLRTWQTGPSNVVWDYGLKASTSLLCEPRIAPVLASSGGVMAGTSLSELQDFIFELGCHVVNESKTRDFKYLLKGTHWDLPETPEVHELWLANVHPILEKLLDYINGLRTEAWQRDPHRSPRQLPNLFLRRLDLFTTKHKCAFNQGKFPLGTDAVVEDIDAIIRDITNSEQPYHTLWDDFEGAVTDILDGSLGVSVATRLGQLPSSTDPRQLSLEDQLRVEMAEHALEFAHPPGQEDSDEVENLKVMLKEWSLSPSEHIREKQRRVFEKLTSESYGRRRFKL